MVIHEEEAIADEFLETKYTRQERAVAVGD
jgi:hypothetical protein